MEETSNELVRTRYGAVLHLRVCPHLRGVTGLITATGQARDALEVCSWCQRELDGVGRIPCGSVDEAMREFGSHPESMALIRSTLSGIEYDELWLPQSRSYVAVGQDRVMVAWVLKTFVGFRDPDRPPVALPAYDLQDRDFAGSPTGAGGERRAAVCTSCFTEMPVSGTCDCTAG